MGNAELNPEKLAKLTPHGVTDLIGKETSLNVVSVSGGKDSTATLLLAIERDVPNLRAVFADTGNEHPATYEYVDYLEQAVGVPIRRVRASFKAQIAKKREWIVARWAKDGVPQNCIDRALELLVPTGNPFLDLCLWKGRFPSVKGRFCTDELKVSPILEQIFIPAIKDGYQVISWQGVRADESASRSKLPESDVGDLGEINYRPILRWAAENCFEMHRKHGVKWNPLYEQGMSRVGCMPCIMARKGELAEIQRRFPEELDRVEQWEWLVSEVSKRGSPTFLDGRIPAALLDDENIHYSTHGMGYMREWALTSRGGRQTDIFADDTPMCLSSYGLCE